MKIELENLFVQKLKDGINLFTGAGFSTLQSPNGEKLPTGKELSCELKKKYSLTDLPEDQELSYVSEFCPDQEYQEYLRERLKVKSYNPLYNVLNKINLKSYITTNIDNIVRLVMDNSASYYLKSIQEYGASMHGANELPYIPLHGDISDLNSKLFFGKFDLSVVDKRNKDLFDQMFGLLAKQPILFWGYSFRDSGVLATVKRLLELGTSDIWIQFLSTETSSIKLFRDKGCHIIEANTEELLKWIDSHIQNTTQHESDILLDLRLKKYKIPTLSEITSVPQKDYYQGGNTSWHPILADIPYERPIIPIIEDSAIKNNCIIITGCKFSGKTTILMQLSRKIHSHNKLYIDGIVKEEAEFILNIIGKREVWIFFNNCIDNILAFNCFAKCKNIHIIGTSDDYHFETVKHLIDKSVSYKIFDCTELQKHEAQNIYNKIPTGIRKQNFVFKDFGDEKYSLLEFISHNVMMAHTKKQISNMFSILQKKDYTSFAIIALTSYLADSGSALSYTNIATLFDKNVYPDAFNMIKHVKNYLREYNFEWAIEDQCQDFFTLRSKLFAISARNVLIEKYKDEFAKTIMSFISKESPYNIAKYDIYKRKGYDSELFSKIFNKEQASYLYDLIYNFDKSPYTLQQWALCLTAFKDYKEAFIKIDKAISENPCNFSFKNSQAIIMFESNKVIGNADAIDYMHKAMEILKQCYLDDKRKLYHAQKFAEFAIFFYTQYHYSDYLNDSKNWLLEVSESNEYTSNRTKKLIDKITTILSHLQF